MEKSGENPGFITVDLATASARPVPVNGMGNANLRTYSLSPEGKSVIAAFREQALAHIVRIPLNGRGEPQELFTATSDVWALDAAPDGSILVSPLERPAEIGQLFVARGRDLWDNQ